jgi:hypothetical protein
MGGTSDYPTVVAGVLRRGLVRRGHAFVLTLDPAFQGLPDTAHGGSVLAAADAAAGGVGPRRLRGTYRRRVPLGVPLVLAPTRGDDAVSWTLADGSGTALVDGRASADVSRRVVDGPPPSGAGHPLPLSTSCFACGLDNPLGLRVALRVDDRAVGGTWTPREAFGDGGHLAVIALTTLLDEAAFWLGALASGESGMTTELDIVLHADVPAGAPVHVGGRRDRVTPHAGDPRFWDTEVAARDDAGRVLADARITFVAVRGAARRLVAGLLRNNPMDVLRRVFPAYTR